MCKNLHPIAWRYPREWCEKIACHRLGPAAALLDHTIRDMICVPQQPPSIVWRTAPKFSEPRRGYRRGQVLFIEVNKLDSCVVTHRSVIYETFGRKVATTLRRTVRSGKVVPHRGRNRRRNSKDPRSHRIYDAPIYPRPSWRRRTWRPTCDFSPSAWEITLARVHRKDGWGCLDVGSAVPATGEIWQQMAAGDTQGSVCKPVDSLAGGMRRGQEWRGRARSRAGADLKWFCQGQPWVGAG